MFLTIKSGKFSQQEKAEMFAVYPWAFLICCGVFPETYGQMRVNRKPTFLFFGFLYADFGLAAGKEFLK